MDYRAQSEAHDGLLPCPHCGEKEHLYLCYPPLGHGDPYAIDCIGCGYDFEPRAGRDVKAAWNRRASSDSHKAIVEALKTAADALHPIQDTESYPGEAREVREKARTEVMAALRLTGEDQ